MKKIKNLTPLLDLALSREKMKMIMGGDYGGGCNTLGAHCTSYNPNCCPGTFCSPTSFICVTF